MEQWANCTKVEFDAWLDRYPRETMGNVHQVCDPPLWSANDPTLGRWPESMVASCKLEDVPRDHRVRVDLQPL